MLELLIDKLLISVSPPLPGKKKTKPDTLFLIFPVLLNFLRIVLIVRCSHDSTTYTLTFQLY